MQFRAFTQGVEVRGEAVLAVIAGMRHLKQRALEILKEQGIENPEPGKWYGQQDWLNAIHKVTEEFGQHTLYSIGLNIPEQAMFPPEIETLEQALESIDVAYQMNHRGGEIGSYQYSKSSEGQMEFVCQNPYPCEFDRGIIEGMARRFAPAGQHLIVRHNDDGPCREQGDESCTYHLGITIACRERKGKKQSPFPCGARRVF